MINNNLSIKKLTSFSNPYGCRVPKKDDLSYECVCGMWCVYTVVVYRKRTICPMKLVRGTWYVLVLRVYVCIMY